MEDFHVIIGLGLGFEWGGQGLQNRGEGSREYRENWCEKSGLQGFRGLQISLQGRCQLNKYRLPLPPALYIYTWCTDCLSDM